MNDCGTAYDEIFAYVRNTEIAHDLAPWWAHTRNALTLENVSRETLDIVMRGMIRAYEEGERSTWTPVK